MKGSYSTCETPTRQIIHMLPQGGSWSREVVLGAIVWASIAKTPDTQDDYDIVRAKLTEAPPNGVGRWVPDGVWIRVLGCAPLAS